MELRDSVIGCLDTHPAVRSVRLVGSRADGSANEFSDWDFCVETNDFTALSKAMPDLMAPLDPLAQQWDRLSPQWCWMLILDGPAKVDLVFPEYLHADEPPWRPARDNLAEIDAHFWDWMLWLRSKAASNKTDLVASELDKLFAHMLAPLGAERRPSTIKDAIVEYREARDRAERRFATVIKRDLETAAAPAFAGLT